MEDFKSIQHQAESLRKNKDFVGAVPLYKKLWEEYRDECNEWEGWRYAFCLKQVKDYKTSLDICREVYKLKPNFEFIKNLYAWCIYYTEISIDIVNDENRFFKAAKGIIKLSTQEDKFSPYVITVFKIVDYLRAKNIYPTDKMYEWISKLNPSLLDTETFKYTDNNGEEKELASNKEKYYSYITKALFKKEMYEQCIELSKEALNTLDTFHYSNDLWLTRRISLSHRALGENEKALEILTKILKKKKDWFIQKEIAETYFSMGNDKKALKYAIEAALNFGDADKKLRLYKFLTDILIHLNNEEDEELIKKQLEFIYHIRKQNNYTNDYEVDSLINKYNITISETADLRAMERALKKVWENKKYAGQTELTGRIKSIFPNGKAGFVETAKKKHYYFSKNSFKGKHSEMKEGQNVRFYLEDGFDAKKNIPSKNATNLRPIK